MSGIFCPVTGADQCKYTKCRSGCYLQNVCRYPAKYAEPGVLIAPKLPLPDPLADTGETR